MVSRRLWLAGAGAALVGPYVAFDDNVARLWKADGSPTEADWLMASELLADDAAGQEFLATTVPLSEALRYEVTPQWVVARWPRVATVVGELEWSGMRVPLIAGSEADAFVGSLTYYFDSRQQLRRISLEGYCGDEREIVALAMQGFGLLPEPSLSGGLYAFRWSGQPLSVLAVQYAPTINADSPHRRRILLEVNRPEPGWRLSPQMQALLRS